MIGIVMAGGKGSRMSLTGEKLLLKYKKSIVLHVIDALVNSKCFSKILAITSSNSPKTKKLLEEKNICNIFLKIAQTHTIQMIMNILWLNIFGMQYCYKCSGGKTIELLWFPLQFLTNRFSVRVF